MYNKINFERNNNGTYDILICYRSTSDTEFGLEFLHSERLRNNTNNVVSYLKRNAKKMQINAVKVLVNGVVIATMSYSAFMNVYGAEVPKYSMAYLYTGTPTQQIAYIDRTQGALGTVSPSYFDINPDGSLKVNTISTELVDHAHSQGMKVIPFVSNHWNRTAGILALDDAENLSTQLANYILQYNLDGINVDIENVTELQRSQYTDFVAKLRSKITAAKEVSVAVAANPNNWQTGWHGSYDYTNLANNSDYLMMMTYDEHWQGSTPGPVASISFVENSIRYALTQTTGDKIVVGLPFYGRIWSEDFSFNGNGITLDRVNEMLTTYNATVSYDNVQKSPYATFVVNPTDPVSTLNGKTLTPGTYTIWYENEASIEAKISLVNTYNLKGVGAWALGQEPSSIWQNYSTWLNPPTVTPEPIVTEPVISYGIVTATNLNVRSSPSTTASILTTLPKGTTVSIIGTANGWYTIKLANAQIGYVSSNYVTISIPTPIVTEPVIIPPPVITEPVIIPPPVIVEPVIIPPPVIVEPVIIPPPVIAQPVVIPPPVITQPITVSGTVTATRLNVRISPTINSKILTTLRKGTTVAITSTVNGWHTIRLTNGQIGYVSSKYIATTATISISTTQTPITPVAPTLTTTSTTGTVKTSLLNVRSGPSTNSRILTTLRRGTNVTITATANGWHTIRLANGQTAYVSSNLISTTTQATSTSNTSKIGIVRTGVLNVRSLPTTNSRVLKILRRGESVNIISTSNGWYTIKLPNGQIAYVSSSLVRL